MYKGFSVSAMVMAAGVGSRMNSPVEKPYINIAGKPILAHTLWQFQRCDIVDYVLAVVGRNNRTRCKRDIVEKFCLTKVKDIVVGGSTRQQSVAIGLRAIHGDIVIIHDGARPFVKRRLIERGIKGLIEQDLEGIACAVPLRDTIKLVDGEGKIKSTLDRESLRAVQTPQCFLGTTIKRVHERAIHDGVTATDDLALLEHYGYKVGLYPGEYNNIKITTAEDLYLAKYLIREHDKT